MKTYQIFCFINSKTFVRFSGLLFILLRTSGSSSTFDPLFQILYFLSLSLFKKKYFKLLKKNDSVKSGKQYPIVNQSLRRLLTVSNGLTSFREYRKNVLGHWAGNSIQTRRFLIRCWGLGSR